LTPFDVFMFPGQGVQSVGMGKDLADDFEAARLIFAEVDEALGMKLSSLMWEGPSEELSFTENAQPAVMAVSMAVMRALRGQGVCTEGVGCVLGHSLGEYSALAAAGSLSIADTVRLLRLRGQAMQKAVPAGHGAMAALIGFDISSAADVVSEACCEGEFCQIANDNSHDQIVVSGTREAVNRAVKIASGMQGKRAVLLKVSVPSHSDLMRSAAEVMKHALSGIEVRRPKVAFIPNVLGRPLEPQSDIRDLLVRQMTSLVRWRESIAYLCDDRCSGSDTHDEVQIENCVKAKRRFFELGSGKVLTNLVRRMISGSDVEVFSVGTSQDVRKAAAVLLA